MLVVGSSLAVCVLQHLCVQPNGVYPAALITGKNEYMKGIRSLASNVHLKS